MRRKKNKDLITMCNICDAGELGKLWTRDIGRGDKTVEEAARVFHMDGMEVVEHIDSHEIVKVAGEWKSDDFYFDKALTSMEYLQAWADEVYKAGEINAATVKSMVSLTKEIRETLKLIAELRGRTGGGNKVQIQVIENKLLMMTNLVLQDTCEECRGRILEALESQQNLDTPAVQAITT